MSIAFAVVKFQIFKVLRTDSASVKRPILGAFWDPTTQLLSDFDEIFTRGSIKNLWKIQIFTEMGDTQSLHFWSNFDPQFLLEEGRNREK